MLMLLKLKKFKTIRGKFSQGGGKRGPLKKIIRREGAPGEQIPPGAPGVPLKIQRGIQLYDRFSFK